MSAITPLPPYFTVREAAEILYNQDRTKFLFRMAACGEISLFVFYNTTIKDYEVTYENGRIASVAYGNRQSGSRLQLNKRQAYMLEMGGQTSYLDDGKTENEGSTLFLVEETPEVGDPPYKFFRDIPKIRENDVYISKEDFIFLRDGIRKDTPLEAYPEPSPKSRNAYLKTIEALSCALIGGLTGKPNTDAEALLAVLALKKIVPPVGKKALAQYLKEANDL